MTRDAVIELAAAVTVGWALIRLVSAIAAVVVHTGWELLDDNSRKGPHCLAPIPAAVAVCSYCTRDVA